MPAINTKMNVWIHISPMFRLMPEMREKSLQEIRISAAKANNNRKYLEKYFNPEIT